MVFCGHCKFLVEGSYCYYNKCCHPSNKRDTPLFPESEIIASPLEINKSNDCPNFAPVRKQLRKNYRKDPLENKWYYQHWIILPPIR